MDDFEGLSDLEELAREHGIPEGDIQILRDSLEGALQALAEIDAEAVRAREMEPDSLDTERLCIEADVKRLWFEALQCLIIHRRFLSIKNTGIVLQWFIAAQLMDFVRNGFGTLDNRIYDALKIAVGLGLSLWDCWDDFEKGAEIKRLSKVAEHLNKRIGEFTGRAKESGEEFDEFI